MTDVIRISVKISGGPVKAFRGRFAQTLHCRNVEAQACSFVGWDDDGRIVNRVVLLPYGADERSALYRHEQAHCNDWRGDLPWIERLRPQARYGTAKELGSDHL